MNVVVTINHERRDRSALCAQAREIFDERPHPPQNDGVSPLRSDSLSDDLGGSRPGGWFSYRQRGHWTRCCDGCIDSLSRRASCVLQNESECRPRGNLDGVAPMYCASQCQIIAIAGSAWYTAAHDDCCVSRSPMISKTAGHPVYSQVQSHLALLSRGRSSLIRYLSVTSQHLY